MGNKIIQKIKKYYLKNLLIKFKIILKITLLNKRNTFLQMLKIKETIYQSFHGEKKKCIENKYYPNYSANII